MDLMTPWPPHIKKHQTWLLLEVSTIALQVYFGENTPYYLGSTRDYDGVSVYKEPSGPASSYGIGMAHLASQPV